MGTTDGKDHYREMVESVRDKRRLLRSGSPIREAVTDEFLRRIADHIEETRTQDLTYGYWPPVFGLVDSLSAQSLLELDADFHLVIEKSDSKKRKELVGFLHARAHDKIGPWYGGPFDIWAKAKAIQSGFPTELDGLLPNGRDHDIRLSIEREISVGSFP